MKLKLDIDPDIVAMMAAEVSAGERAVSAAIREAGVRWLSYEGPSVVTSVRDRLTDRDAWADRPHFVVALDAHPGSDVEVAREKAGAAIESAKASLPSDLQVTTAVVEGASVEEAVEKLTWRDGDLLMLGSSRLAPPRRLFIGSTAARILRVLDVPIVVTPRGDD